MAITTEVSSITTMLDARRNLEMISFIVVAWDSYSKEKYELPVVKLGGLPTPEAGLTQIPDPRPPNGEEPQMIEVSLPYTQGEIDRIVEAVITEQNARERAAGFLQVKLVNPANPHGGYPMMPSPVPPATDWECKAVWIRQVDNSVAAVFSKWTRFQMEYEQREKAALAFKNSGYAGAPSLWITSFAEPVGLSNRVATDLILAQAQRLRKAIEQLGVQRMSKYRILNAASIAEAETEFNMIINAVIQIDTGLAA
jgi:hypothetical protein